ncbi:MAG: transcription antitermination factor NusB [Actinomycetota bacterium]
MSARSLAHAVLVRVDVDRAWVAPALDGALRRSRLDDRDRALATELVYGVTRRRRAIDAAARPFVKRDLDPDVRAAVRIGTYQLLEQRVPAHAAVSEAVDLAPRRASGLVNAVLRRVAEAGMPGGLGPAERLSYPDWLVDRLVADLGQHDAHAALAEMNVPVETPARADGYRQDPASTWVAELVEAEAGETVVDLCAAPGGKATVLAASGADVIACELHPARARGVVGVAEATGHDLSVVVADARSAALRPGSADRVLLDAPCSGLGALRRRADARWRIDGEAVERLAALQIELLDAAADLVRPGGRLVYSVCTITTAETIDVVDRVLAERSDLDAEVVDPGSRWRVRGRGVLTLPQDHRTDGMFACVLRRRRAGDG